MKNCVSCAEDVPSVSTSMPLERKAFRLHKWHIISLILTLVVFFQLVMYLNLDSKFNLLSSNYDSLKDQHSAVESSYDLLQSEYSTLETQHNTLQTQYNGLKKNYDSLQFNYTSVSSNYTKLKSQYDSLKLDYNSLQSNYTALDAKYDSLKTQYDAFISDYADLSYFVNQRSQYLDISKFITPNDASVRQTVTQVTGGWSNPSDTSEFWIDIKAMYDWVVTNIEYRYDGLYPVLPSVPSGSLYYTTEMWQFPNETLTERKGDCEDMAILLTSMILNYDEEKYWTECILITSSLGGHAGVQIPVAGNKITILDPAGNYYTADAWGNLAQKDFSTEINNWLNYWKPDLGNDVYVYRLFANYMDKTFASTSEYISWMYANR